MEKKTKSMVWKVLLAVVVISVVGIGTALVKENKVSDNAGTCTLEPYWDAPKIGTPVQYYLPQMRIINKEGVEKTLDLDRVTTNSLTVTVDCGSKVWIRVAGVDADGCQGPWSVWSLEKYAEMPVPRP